MNASDRDLATWLEHRPLLLRLAYRMLGEMTRAEDMVQESWLRYAGREADVEDVRSYLVAIVTRLCLNDLSSARARREEARGDRLPEPVDLATTGLEPVESAERVSMAFMVVLQRLSPAERAVLLLHDVVDMDHAEIARLVERSESASRKLLERARAHVSAENRFFETTREEHQRLLEAFVSATTRGDVAALVALLSDEATLITDGGAGGRTVAGVRNLSIPLVGAVRVAAFISHITGLAAPMLAREERTLNGQPALVFHRDGEPFAALLLGVAGGKIERVFFQGDTARLQRLATRPS